MTRRLMQGSDAIADAAILAGCRFFTGYPMLPFTELLEDMARKLPEAGGVCINANSEIEAVNMALGAAATGARAATGSCGQGLALMQEGIAELALNELPLVVFNMARGQQDYFQATRGGGWGDYRTITLAPRDVPEAVAHTQLLFDLADRYRTPTILYGDYVIAHTSVGIEVERLDFGPLPAKDWALDGSMSGTGQARQIWTWARGKPNTPGPGPSQAWETIAEKYAHIEEVEPRFEADRVDDAEVLVVSFGTTAVFVDRVVDELRAEGVRIGSFRPVTLWPFPGRALAEATEGCAHVLVYELNAGQMVDDVRMHAADRSVIRSIGGVSQDSSGMRQGDLLNATEVRTRVERAIAGTGAAVPSGRTTP
jgi:2-oxoglutarate ferredoxin oxidoreductase subunit alpha